MEETVVLYPLLAVSHMAPMVELAKLLLHAGFSTTILILPTPFPISSVESLIAHVSATHPSIVFHRLPTLPQPPTPHSGGMLDLFNLLRLHNTNIRSYLRSISPSTTIRAMVLDIFCTDALDVAAELGIPSYFLSAPSAATFAVFLHLPTLDQQLEDKSFDDLGKTPLHFPGLPPIPASHMVDITIHRGDLYDAFLRHCARYPLADGILVNSFEHLEPRAVRAITDGLCVPGRPTPPIYCIGPLITNSHDEGEGENRHECLKWLDTQPRESVVFLCFGSMGRFPAEQIKYIATGLEKSGQRFLWVVKSPPSADLARQDDRAESDLGELLPEGFLERTNDRGMVVMSWCPQVAVLAHKAVGGFVTHCGWNSVLEAVCAGVPMVGWPMYAEQRMNMVILSEEMKLAVRMEGYDEELVAAGEVEEKVRWLIESAGGTGLRDRAALAKVAAAAALKEGGSSRAAFLQLVSQWKTAN